MGEIVETHQTLKLLVTVDPDQGTIIEFYWDDDPAPAQIVLGKTDQVAVFGCKIKGEISPAFTRVMIGADSKQAMDHLTAGEVDAACIVKNYKEIQIDGEIKYEAI